MFRRSLLGLVSLLTLGALALTAAPAHRPAPRPPLRPSLRPAAAQTVTVAMQGHQFVDPTSGNSTTTINVGDSVQWTAVSNGPHTATADDLSFDTGIVQNGATSLPVPFTHAGTFPYHCQVHGTSMSGTVVVQ